MYNFNLIINLICLEHWVASEACSFPFRTQVASAFLYLSMKTCHNKRSHNRLRRFIRNQSIVNTLFISGTRRL